jgi:hypothetical protein
MLPVVAAAHVVEDQRALAQMAASDVVYTAAGIKIL